MNQEKHQSRTKNISKYIYPFSAAGILAREATPTGVGATPPLPFSSITPTWENLQETTARLLFMAVRWVKCLVPFQTLSVRDQVIFKIQNISRKIQEKLPFQLLLLQESWKDLFLLHLSQWAVPWDLSNLLSTRQNNLRTNGHILPIEEEVFDMEVKTIQVCCVL